MSHPFERFNLSCFSSVFITICKYAQKRLFLDVANYVVITIREELKTNWIDKFSGSDDFSSKEEALEKLKSKNEFIQRPKNVENRVSFDNIDKLNAVARDLLNKDDSILPEDFTKLRDLIQKRINETR